MGKLTFRLETYEEWLWTYGFDGAKSIGRLEEYMLLFPAGHFSGASLAKAMESDKGKEKCPFNPRLVIDTINGVSV